MFLKILSAVIAVIALFVVVVALQPSDFRIARSVTIAAPPEIVFAQVNDLHKMNSWSPWLEADPNVHLLYAGPESGPGATFSWVGNNKVGEGQLSIAESHPNDLVRINMQFLKPLRSTATAEFTIKSEGDRAQVTWAMFGKRPFAGKAIGLFVNMDKMIGGNFEKGLNKMKMVIESSSAK